MLIRNRSGNIIWANRQRLMILCTTQQTQRHIKSFQGWVIGELRITSMRQQEPCQMCVLCRKLCRFCPWRFIQIAVFLSVLWPAISSFGQSVPAALLGDWRLVELYSTTSLQGLPPKEEKGLVGTTVVFRANSLTACGQSVDISSAVSSRISSDDLLFEYHATFKSVGITSQSVEMVLLNNDASGNCLGELTIPGELVYLKSQDEICINFDGAFFKAVRIKSKTD